MIIERNNKIEQSTALVRLNCGLKVTSSADIEPGRVLQVVMDYEDLDKKLTNITLLAVYGRSKKPISAKARTMWEKLQSAGKDKELMMVGT